MTVNVPTSESGIATVGMNTERTDPRKAKTTSVTMMSASASVQMTSSIALFTNLVESRSEERRVGKECRSLCDWSSDVCSSDLHRSEKGEDDQRDDDERFGERPDDLLDRAVHELGRIVDDLALQPLGQLRVDVGKHVA